MARRNKLVIYGLLIGVFLLAFANGANDNFKGVATLWATGRYSYRTVLGWGTLCTFVGSVLGSVLAGGLVPVFSGSRFLGKDASLDPVFLAAVALGAAVTVLLATRIGAPVSTTHALAGSLVGAGLLAVGAAQVRWTAAASSIAAPLLFSPLLALGLTVGAYPLVARWLRARNCLCVTEPAAVVLGDGDAAAAARGVLPSLRIAASSECARGDEVTRWNTEELVHWTSAGLISFSRGLNDTPKIAALVLAAGWLSPATNHVLIAVMMALGGLVAARSVANTMARRVTPIEPAASMTANLTGALLVTAASRWGLPVSTTHVTMGAIFGVGVHRREQTNWALVRQIVAAWIITLPLGLVCGLVFYYLLRSLI